MKNKINIKLVLLFLIAIVMTSGISIYATYEYLASNIDYTKQGTNTTIKVSEALDELYKNSKETSDETKSITSNGEQTLDKYYKNINVNVTTDKVYTQAQYDAKTVAQTKTLLWTNPNPNSSMAGTDITLSSSFANFTHILIQWKATTSSTTIYDDIFKVQPYRSQTLGDGNLYSFGTETSDGSLLGYTRYLRYLDSTSARFPGTRVHNGTDSNANAKCIPVAIYGLNFTY